MTEAWNPRYVAYAAAHGRDPRSMLAHDADAFPGGKMAGFLVWNSAHWEEFKALHNLPRRDPAELHMRDAHARYNAWLASRYNTQGQNT